MDTNSLMIVLAIVSALTTMTVQAIKHMLNSNDDAKYSSNALAAIVAVVLSLAVMIIYHVYFTIPFDSKSVVEIVVVIFLSWLVSQLNYDKVIGLLKQLNGNIETKK